MDPPTGPSDGRYDYDLLIVGGGSGGLAVAKEAAGHREKVLILDLTATSPRGTRRVLGGSFLNRDSVRRFFQHSSLLGEALHDSLKHGWKFPNQGLCHGWTELVQTVQQQIESDALELRRELKKHGVFYLNARAGMVAPHTVEATDMDGRRRILTAETVVIATGDRPQSLGVPGEKEHCLTSEDLLSSPRPPGRTLLVGGSAEALECAGFLLGLGHPVVVMPQPDLLPGLDRKMAEKIENQMLVAGVDFQYHCALIKVEQAEDVTAGDPSMKKLRVTFSTKDGQTTHEVFDTLCHIDKKMTRNLVVRFVQVVLAIGRKACTGDIGLESVGVQHSKDTGRIIVNAEDQTSVDHIYAIGSVQHGRPSNTSLSMHAGKLLARRLYGDDNNLCDYTCVPTVVLTPMEYASCGLSEEKASLTFGEASIEVYHSYYWPQHWVLPAKNKNSCYVKVICHVPDQERVVGLHIMGPNAGDILQGFVTALKCGLTKQQLDATVGVHPGSAQVLTSLTQTQRMSEALMQRGNC